MSMEKAVILFLSGLVVVYSVVDPRPNFDACERCDNLYLEWHWNRTSRNFWSDTESAIEAADIICAQGERIRDTCYDVCGLSPYNNTMKDTRSRSLKLTKFLNAECLVHNCRVADLTYCETQGTEICHADTWACKNTHLADRKCIVEAEQPQSLCLPAQRRLWAEMLKDESACYFSFNVIQRRDIPSPSRPQVWGLQQCKDIFIAGCVLNWHTRDLQLDMNRFTELNNAQRDEICSQKDEAFKCFDNLDSGAGVIEYKNYNYTAPCNQSLMTNPDKFVQARDNMRAVYTAICADSFPEMCADIWQMTTRSRSQRYTESPLGDTTPKSTSSALAFSMMLIFISVLLLPLTS